MATEGQNPSYPYCLYLQTPHVGGAKLVYPRIKGNYHIELGPFHTGAGSFGVHLLGGESVH